MRQALLLDDKTIDDILNSPLKWAILPGLCCQAAGGELHEADDIATAWYLFYVGAHIMDTIEDQDQPDPWWADLGPGVALNVASGLFFTASLALNKLFSSLPATSSPENIVEDFHKSFLNISSGQHLDLITNAPSLEQCWEIAAAKSGSFFGLACRSGARMGTEESARIKAYSEYGHNLGMVIQIFDDIKDFKSSVDADTRIRRINREWSIPLAYAMEVFPPSKRAKLSSSMNEAVDNPEAVDKVFKYLESSGVTLYLITKLEHHRNKANASLNSAEPDPEAGDILLSFLNFYSQ